jgi:hypothetical protein
MICRAGLVGVAKGLHQLHNRNHPPVTHLRTSQGFGTDFAYIRPLRHRASNAAGYRGEETLRVIGCWISRAGAGLNGAWLCLHDSHDPISAQPLALS